MKENAKAFWIIKLTQKINLPYAINLNVSGVYINQVRRTSEIANC